MTLGGWLRGWTERPRACFVFHGPEWMQDLSEWLGYLSVQTETLCLPPDSEWVFSVIQPERLPHALPR